MDGGCVLARRREMGHAFLLGRLAETASQFEASERDAISPRGSFRKRYPSLDPRNGARFPNGGSDGNHVPEFRFKAGRTFRMASQTETVSRNTASEWDAVSG